MEKQIAKTSMEVADHTNSRTSDISIHRTIPLALIANLLLLTVIELSIVIWTSYDKSIPCWDTAAHKLNSFYVYELLQHPHLRDLDWYRHIFAVSPLYPPLFYILSASLKLTFANSLNSELISNMIFAAMLFGSIFYITKSTFKNKISASISAILVFLFPAVFWSAHCALLDFGAIAMVALALACFLWWSENPKISKSILLGFVFGLALLTKNNTPIFLIGPVLVELIHSLKRMNSKIDYFRLRHLFLVAAISFLVILPWLFLAGPAVSQFITSIQQQNFQVANNLTQSSSAIAATTRPSYIAEFFTHLHRFTLEDLPVILSPILSLCFLAALLKTIPLTKNKTYLLASIVFSILAASAFRWPHQFRYIVPAAVPIAVLIAGFFGDLWFTKKIRLRSLLITILVLATLQLVSEAFCPYPITLPTWTQTILQATGANFKTHGAAGQMPGVSVSPLPESESGIVWCLANIETNGGGKLTNVMVMPNANPINCSPFYYLTKIRKDNIEIASPREHTELGDKVTFNRDKATSYQWYILKTGDQGISMCSEDSSRAYEIWLDFIRNSGSYKLVNTKQTPDGSFLELYRNYRLDSSKTQNP